MKFALLRHLHSCLSVSLGINWYLTERSVDHPLNKDGEKRHHLNGGVWERWDSELFGLIKVFEDSHKRVIENIRTQHILPAETVYFEEIISVTNRKCWHERGVAALASADLVFLDPDNGFEVKSASKKAMPKYALYDEAVDYCREGKIVVAIQFARQCKPESKAKDVKAQLYNRASYSEDLPVLRARVAPNILFLFVAPPTHITALEKALAVFSNKSGGKAELIWSRPRT